MSTAKRLGHGLSQGAPEPGTPSYEAETREGEGPREGETQESQDAVSRRDPAADIPTGEGIKPLKRDAPAIRSVPEGAAPETDGEPAVNRKRGSRTER